ADSSPTSQQSPAQSPSTPPAEHAATRSTIPPTPGSVDRGRDPGSPATADQHKLKPPASPASTFVLSASSGAEHKLAEDKPDTASQIHEWFVSPITRVVRPSCRCRPTVERDRIARD